MMDLRCGTCVVGSGAGGAAAAGVLAEGGGDVLLLEAGLNHDPRSFDQLETSMVPRLYSGAGLETTADQGVLLLSGRGLGGSTVHNTGLAVPPPAVVLDAWNERGALPGGRAALEEAVQETRLRLGSRLPDPDEVNQNNALLRRGADALGLEVTTPEHCRSRCSGCGFCILGCAYNRKRNAVFAWIEQGVASGLRVRTGVRVDRLIERRLDYEVRGPGFRVLADRVVVAASALRTPALLRRSGMGGRTMGATLRLHPFAPVGAVFDEPVEAWRGVPQSVLVTGGARFLRGGTGGHVFMAGAAGPGGTASFLPVPAGEATAAMASYRHLAAAGVLLHDEGRGSVRPRRDGTPKVRYWLSPDDRREMAEGIMSLGRLWFAAGARRVMLPYRSRPYAATPSDLLGLDALPLRPHDVVLSSVHPQGTAPLGREPNTPVRPDGRVRGTRGVYVADASLFPTSLGVPPQVTIMAFSAVIARGIHAEEGGGR